MPSLKELRKKFPSAETVAGSVVAFEGGKHINLGTYVGEGMVVLSSEGEALLAPPKKEEEPASPEKAKAARHGLVVDSEGL